MFYATVDAAILWMLPCYLSLFFMPGVNQEVNQIFNGI